MSRQKGSEVGYDFSRSKDWCILKNWRRPWYKRNLWLSATTNMNTDALNEKFVLCPSWLDEYAPMINANILHYTCSKRTIKVDYYIVDYESIKSCYQIFTKT